MPRQTSPQKPSISIYWDFQNVHSIQKLASLLLAFAKSKGRLISTKLYYNSLCNNQAYVISNLNNFEISFIDVPCPLKNSADNQLIADCLEDIDSNQSSDIFIIVSGDGDFVKLVRSLQKLGKKVIIFAQKGNVKQKLKELADNFHFVDDLPQLVVENNQPQITSIKSQINYNEAIEYLVKAIKIALSQGKSTVLGYINNLMREHFPNYQGFSCICTPDGKKFSRFSKFVDAAVKEGKVRMQNQKLLLIE
jgi:hypothetical protein